MAPRSSSSPVAVTMMSGLGKSGGSMRMRSGRRFPQWADAVRRNIANNVYDVVDVDVDAEGGAVLKLRVT
jgi:hypothetical protein